MRIFPPELCLALNVRGCSVAVTFCVSVGEKWELLAGNERLEEFENCVPISHVLLRLVHLNHSAYSKVIPLDKHKNKST